MNDHNPWFSPPPPTKTPGHAGDPFLPPSPLVPSASVSTGNPWQLHPSLPPPNIAFQQNHYFKRNTSITAQAVLLQILLTIVFQVGLFFVLGLLFLDVDLDDSPAFIAVMIISMIAANLLATLYCMRRSGISSIRRFFAGVHPSPSLFGTMLVLLFGAQLAGGLISNLLHTLLSSVLGYEVPGFDFPLPEDVLSILLYGVLICVVAPITEELLFRGAILNTLSRYGTVFAVVISSLLFSLLHMNLDQIPFTFLAGLIFGFLAIKTGSTVYPILLHAINNTAAFVLTLLTEQTAAAESVELIFGLFTLLCAIASVFLLLLARRNHPANTVIPGHHRWVLISHDPRQRQGDNLIAITYPYRKFCTRPAVLVFFLVVFASLAITILSPLIEAWLLPLLEELASL